ncbi:hypothetical protein EDB80DRAFT_833450 [Ilyonectria destructans]|nr:hypothetical protein EDB80DRAFT_833450 [Ilyonectria destructans]
MTAPIPLPPIDGSGNCPLPPTPGYGYPPNLCYASPNVVNGYPHPGQQAQPPGVQSPSLLLPQTQTDPRSPAYPRPDQRGGYDGRHPPRPGYGYEPYRSGPYHAYRGHPPQGHPPPNSYRNYNVHLANDINGYPPGGLGTAPHLTQAAPRQRTSIACRYCRKRKIRCRGYESSPGGKCHNCVRTNQECVFQPVSSSSTAFIPVSAVSGDVPPGTQLVGAYGQPLGPSLEQTQHSSLLELGGQGDESGLHGSMGRPLGFR